jgi:hypothetical protein
VDVELVNPEQISELMVSDLSYPRLRMTRENVGYQNLKRYLRAKGYLRDNGLELAKKNNEI